MSEEVERPRASTFRPPVTKQVPGIGTCEVKAPNLRMELQLGAYFDRPTRVNYRRFASVVIASSLRQPKLSTARIDQLTDRARASLRVATAEAAGVVPHFRRLQGTFLSGDERLFAALLYQRQARTKRLAEAAAPALRSLSDAATASRQSPALEKLLRQNENIARMFRSPAFDSLAETQRKLAGLGKSPFFENLQRRNESIARMFRSPAFDSLAVFALKTRHVLSDAFVRSFEAAAAYLDQHWAEMQTAHPDHPPPVLFIVASLPMAVGLPLYEAVKQQADGALLDVLEPVLTEPAFVQELQAAIQQAPHLNEVARRHLVTACQWLGQRSYVDAYPPFYNGLESGFSAVARSANVIDSDNRFLIVNPSAKKASKVEDLFAYLPMDAQYRRYLRSWIFGDRGNPFRHGGVSDPDDCRRQSLRLAVATIGWLETFGGWSGSSFQARLEAEAMRQAS